jgi:hypothetical protein
LASQVLDHVQVHLLLHAGDAFDATGHEHIGLAGDDALRCQWQWSAGPTSKSG